MNEYVETPVIPQRPPKIRTTLLLNVPPPAFARQAGSKSQKRSVPSLSTQDCSWQQLMAKGQKFYDA